MATDNRNMGGFSHDIGETQRSGDARVLGLSRAPSMAGVAGSEQARIDLPLQVQSIFDTRPIEAYDFSLEIVGQPPQNENFDFSAAVPDQYTMILRRIEFQFFPPFVGGVTSATGSDLTLWLMRNSIQIPNNVVTLRASYPTYTWETHQVFGSGQTYGIGGLFEVLDPPPVSGSSLEFIARFMGTLILSRGRPPQHEVGSLPTFVRGEPK